MRRKTFWTVLSCLTVLALMLTSLSSAAEKPKYGGTLNAAWMNSPKDFDQAYRTAWLSWTLDSTNEKSFAGDVMLGPAGTGELKLTGNVMYTREQMRSLCIEKWEAPKPELWVLHVRKGVHFHDKPPVNGREMEAQDVVVSFKRMFTMAGSWLAKVPNRPVRIEATDKYTLEVEFPIFDPTMAFRIFDTIFIIPREAVWDKDGNETEGLRDWKNANGTGAFMLTDYKPDASVTFKKNPNYWQTDPFTPGNKLPYIDGIEVKIIPELTTIIAALRTGRIDFWREINWEQAQSLKKTNPELQFAEIMNRSSYEVTVRSDIEPFSDIRVRQALSMAIDRDSIVNDLYHGSATYLHRFYSPYEPDFHIPYDKLPAHIKEVYTYNPEKAQKLLAEAGYPNGFKTSILTRQLWSDETTFVSANWTAIGVETKVDIREEAIFTSIRYAMTYPGAFVASYNNQPGPNQGDAHLCKHYSNYGKVCDEKWDAMYQKVLTEPDYDKMAALMREMNLYALEKAWIISLPSPNSFVIWHDHLKRWGGAYVAGVYGFYHPFSYAWLDK